LGQALNLTKSVARVFYCSLIIDDNGQKRTRLA
jgi:hypothetical protein